MKKLFYILLATFFTLSSCKDTKQPQQEENITEMPMENENIQENSIVATTTIQSDVTTPVLDAYFNLKNALVAENKTAAAAAGKVFLAALTSFDTANLSETQQKEFLEIAGTAKEHAQHIIKSALDHQVEHFVDLSIDVKDLITLVGTNKTIYQVHCPMYHDGAIWLSEFKEVKNPYFGSKMLTCGTIQTQFN